MLKALELAGFKSFADKTRFEFPPGITVVVGPNGSGKSNIVDAIKWVLGEQSAKSLRGKEMTDVIFKGSGSGRKPLNTAEATLIFDNADRTLAIDAPEVHVTRRVYRSGEGEYLLNRQACRMKDIKDLFRGTGVGTDAYSLIEQGKVDRLLQASSKDRRAIFEEAAGISRFKAKKAEAQRRLERVEQNLLRLNDIVEEVDNRLRSVRAQASKAKRYREYSERLQLLRTEVGLTDWRQLSTKLAAIESDLSRLKNEAAESSARAERIEAQFIELENEVSQLHDRVRVFDGQFGRCREQIATLESNADHERSRSRDLDESAARDRTQLQNLLARADELAQKLAENHAALDAAERHHAEVRDQLAEHERRVAELATQIESLRAANERRRAAYVDGMRGAAQLVNRITTLTSEAESCDATTRRSAAQIAELEKTRAELQEKLAAIRREEQAFADAATARAAELEQSTVGLDENRRLLARRQEEWALMQGRLRGAEDRASILEELERNREGLGEGVKEVLARARLPANGPFADVRGLVAELLQAPVDMAPLIDVALGEAAQHVVIGGSRLLDALQSGAYKPAGRVGFVTLDDPTPRLAAERIDLSQHEGVVGRADRIVEFATEFETLVRRLLGTTWFVENLSTALSLAQYTDRGLRFVTLAGELIDRDGTLIVGPRQAAVGLVSRRSELRMIREQIADLAAQIRTAEDEIGRLQENIERQALLTRRLADEQQQANSQLADRRAQSLAMTERFERLDKQKAVLEAELRAAKVRRETTEQSLEEARQNHRRTETELEQVQASIRGDDRQIAELEATQQVHSQAVTAAKVAQAKSEQMLAGLRAQRQQIEDDQRERQRALHQARQQLAEYVRRQRETELAILRATSELATLFLHKEHLAHEVAEATAQRDVFAAQRAVLNDELHGARRRLRSAEEQLHQQDLAANEVRHQRATMAERLKDDYGIDIASAEATLVEDPEKRSETETEIADLRQKINRLGAVNLDALAELDDLESRFGSLSTQFQDLKQAKEALERIIVKINTDSRRIFVETLEAIRTNFQALYRKAFGGGHADLVLEEGVDVLEAGVEILATPPGKPSFSNTLLSGGEKALTAVSLLMAIFQFRPSPFCILDEVDAPFDEANIGRFINVLKDFLKWTRFVIVTHSKKTMTAATTLYGITMQESGVSKQVSVRFEDVSEDGQISQAALEREGPAKAEDAA